MEELKQELKKYQKQDLDKSLQYAYATALKTPKFKALINKFQIKESIAYKNTSKLERVVEELSNCEGCKGLAFCHNPTSGYVYYPDLKEERLAFSYAPCRYKKTALKNQTNTIFYELPVELQNARMKNIDITDKTRAKVIKWLKEFYDNYLNDKNQKGLYLHGSFGSGKTYLILAVLNELALRKVSIAAVYYPFLLRNLKESFSDDFKERIDYLLNVDILLLDDVGAENNTSWSRDEILGTILQHRMDNSLTTFLTSNLTITELEEHLCNNKGDLEKVKARRIIERIKQLTSDMELISVNRRK